MKDITCAICQQQASYAILDHDDNITVLLCQYHPEHISKPEALDCVKGRPLAHTQHLCISWPMQMASFPRNGGSMLSTCASCRFQRQCLPVLCRQASARKRFYSTKAVIRYAVTAEANEKKKAESEYVNTLLKTLKERRPWTGTTPQQAQNFVNYLRAGGAGAPSRAIPYEQALFEKARDKFSMSEDDAFDIGVVLMGSQLREDRSIVDSIFQTLALRGHKGSFAYVVGNRLYPHPEYPEKTIFKDSPKISRYRAAMQKEMFDTGDNVSLEAEFHIRIIEDPATALQFLEQMIHVSSTITIKIGEHAWQTLDGVFLRQLERAVKEGNTLLVRQILEKLIRTADIGVTHDDALSFYLKAEYVQRLYVIDQELRIKRRKRPAGEIGVCREWLYYMNRAGASGFVPAAEALGHFYSKHLDTWVEKNQSDYDKQEGGEEDSETITSRCLHALGLTMRQQDPVNSIAKQAIFLDDADKRLALAIYWHEAAASFGYAPAWLSIARLRLTPTFKATKAKEELKNPVYNKQKGAYALAKLWQALRAFDVHESLKSSKNGQVSYENSKVAREFDQNMHKMSFASDSKHSEILKQGIWSFALSVDVFRSWTSSNTEVENLARDMEALADKSGCDIVLDDMLIYTHKKSS